MIETTNDFNHLFTFLFITSFYDTIVDDTYYIVLIHYNIILYYTLFFTFLFDINNNISIDKH